MRLFIAIELSSNIRSHLVAVQDAVRNVAPALSFTRAENLHLTLKFLGDVPDAGVAGLIAALEAIAPVGQFALATAGILCFPDRGRIRVISADVNAAGALHQLHGRIEAAAEQQGFARENRPFHPHITLARARMPLAAPMRAKLSAVAQREGPAPSMVVKDFVLMQSRLHPEGARFAPAARFYINLPYTQQ